MVKQPSTDELLFQVIQRQDEKKSFIIECEAEGEPEPAWAHYLSTELASFIFDMCTTT